MPNLRQFTFCRLLNGSACCFRQARYYRHFTCRRRLPLAARLTFLGSRDSSALRSGPDQAHSAVADNTLTIKQKSTLPVGKTRQDKSLFRSLLGAYLPPLTVSCVCREAIGRPAPAAAPCPARPSPASTSARCEPFSENRLTPASRDSGSGPDTMAAGARKQAASCDAFVLSRRRPAPDAPLISFAKIRGFKVADYSPCPAPCPAGLAVESPPMRGTSTDA